MKELKFAILLLAASFLMACGSGNQEESTGEKADASEIEQITGSVSFASFADGDTLSSPFYLEMAIEGMEVEPKGESRDGYGHHHLLINDGFVQEGIVIIADSTHIHYGGGQTQDSIALNPGNYQLTLQFGDGAHVSYGEQWAQTVNVVVK
jgi:hypothetical protein